MCAKYWNTNCMSIRDVLQHTYAISYTFMCIILIGRYFDYVCVVDIDIGNNVNGLLNGARKARFVRAGVMCN